VTHRIAITGKGGTGKTTISALIVLGLIRKGRRPVLAVDADPNMCLDAALGVTVQQTVGGVREDAREIAGKGTAQGVPKQQLLEMKIAQSLVEADDFDLIAMGRPEGPGCYCYANNVLRSTLDRVASGYPHLVIDNEAGLENLSRRIVQKTELLVLVSDASHQGLRTVERLHLLAREMEIAYDRLAIIVNRLRQDELPPAAQDLKTSLGADLILGLPDDEQLTACAAQGEPLVSLPSDNPVVARIDRFLQELGL
jgi:CO dehydrogenase maturation factor